MILEISVSLQPGEFFFFYIIDGLLLVVNEGALVFPWPKDYLAQLRLRYVGVISHTRQPEI